jgi:hypothetical protein
MLYAGLTLLHTIILYIYSDYVLRNIFYLSKYDIVKTSKNTFCQTQIVINFLSKSVPKHFLLRTCVIKNKDIKLKLKALFSSS